MSERLINLLFLPRVFTVIQQTSSLSPSLSRCSSPVGQFKYLSSFFFDNYSLPVIYLEVSPYLLSRSCFQ